MEFFKKYSTQILLLFIVLELLGILVIRLMYLPFDKADFHNTIMPIISAAGFMAIIVSIWYVKKGNDEKLSYEYYNYYSDVIDELRIKGETTLLKNFAKDYNIHTRNHCLNFEDLYVEIINNNIKNSPQYKRDCAFIKKGGNLKTFDLEQKSYYSSFVLIANLNFNINFFYDECYNTLQELRSKRKIFKHHEEMLIKSIINHLLSSYIIFCSKVRKGEISKLDDVLTAKIGTEIYEQARFFVLYDKINEDDYLSSFVNEISYKASGVKFF